MPRTYSLSRLMLGITIFCITCGLAVKYPEEAFEFSLAASLTIPAIVVMLLLVSFSRQRLTLSVVALVGALFGALFAPSTLYYGPSLDWWQNYKQVFMPATIPTALGALVFGGAVLTDELFQRRSAS